MTDADQHRGSEPAMTGNPHLADGSRAVGLLGALAAGVGAGGVLRSIRGGLPGRAAQRPGEGSRLITGVTDRGPAAPIAQPTANATAKPIDYPVEDLRQAGTVWPWRRTALFALTVATATSSGLFSSAAVGGSRR